MADDFNSMQANMGLFGSGGSFSPVGIPTPQVMHPGQVSQMAAQTAQAASFSTLQQTGQTPLGAYAQQYQQNMAGIQGQQFNPFVAQTMAGMNGMPGFMPGMLPSPTSMTPASMGIFRPFPQGPSPVIPPTPHLPLIPTPFTPHFAPPAFHTGLEYMGSHAYHRGLQWSSAMQAVPGVAARAGVDYGAAMFGGAFGARLGGHFGAGGAAIGGMLGAAGGLFGSEHFGLGQATQNFVNQLNPVRELALRSAQFKGMSPEWVVGGGALDYTGRGLSSPASANLARRIEDIGFSSDFRQSTGNRFSVQDLTRITQMAGGNGMLDAAQNPEQIARAVKGIARSLSTIMKIAGEPDVAAAMKMMGQMHSMGLAGSEATGVLQNAKMYARMAGTSVNNLMATAGNQGAMVFQSQGLSAGLGLDIGMGSLGLARQAVAGGTFSPQQLALLGGTQGVAQRNMEMSAAMLKMPMMAAAMGGAGAGGTFGLNGGNMAALASGKVDINGMAGMGADNLLAAVQKHGVGALGMFMAQQEEMQDSMGRALGPMGMKALQLRQVMNTQKMLGLSGPGGFVTAAMGMGMDSKSAMQLMRESNSPEFFRNVQRQFNVQRQDLRMAAAERRDATAPGTGDWLASRGGVAGDVTRGVMDFADKFGHRVDDLRELMVSMPGELSEGWEAFSSGRRMMRNPASFQASGLEARMISALSSGDRQRFMRELFNPARAGNAGTAAMFNIGGRDYGRNSFTGAWQDRMGGDPAALAEVLRAEGGLGGTMLGITGTRMGNLVFGGSASDTMARADSIRRGSNAILKGLGASESEETEALTGLDQATGGKGGRLASAFARKIAQRAKDRDSLVGKGGVITGDDHQQALKEAAAEIGIDASKVNLGQLVTATTKDARALAGPAGHDAFRMPSMELAEFANGAGDRDALLQAQESIAEKMFGENGLFETDSDRTEALSAMFGQNEDPRVAAAAALLAAAQSGDKQAEARLAQFMNGLSNQDRTRVMAAARKMAGGASSSQKSYLRRAGEQMKANGSNKGLLENVTKSRNNYLASKAIAKERGWDQDGKLIGGDRAEEEAGLDKQSENYRQLEGEMARNFPDAVATFSKASRLLHNVAVLLGNKFVTDKQPDINTGGDY